MGPLREASEQDQATRNISNSKLKTHLSAGIICSFIRTHEKPHPGFLNSVDGFGLFD
jgi:hypothetical protein